MRGGCAARSLPPPPQGSGSPPLRQSCGAMQWPAVLLLGLLLVPEARSSGRPLQPTLAARAEAQPDEVISLQGSIPLDADGQEVRDSLSWLRGDGGGSGGAPCCPLRAAPSPPQVHAHGGQLLRSGGTYYWVGTSRKEQAALVSSDISLYAAERVSGPWRPLGSIFNWRQIEGFPDRWP